MNGSIDIVRQASKRLEYRKDDPSRSYGRLTLHEGPSGATIKLQHFEPGVITPLHTHTCGHGMYVLSGTLHTNVGDLVAGDFVWFEAGTQMEHGSASEPLDMLFFTDSPFDITYVEKDC